MLPRKHAICFKPRLRSWCCFVCVAQSARLRGVPAALRETVHAGQDTPHGGVQSHPGDVLAPGRPGASDAEIEAAARLKSRAANG